MKHQYTAVALVILCVVVTACRGSPPRPSPPFDSPLPALTPTVASPTLWGDRPLCGLTIPESQSPWWQYWRFSDDRGGVSALCKDEDWLWVGTPRGLVRLDLRTLDCRRLERADAAPGVPLGRIYTLLRDPAGCLWAASDSGVARRCTDAPDASQGWQPVSLKYSSFQMAFDADGNLWIAKFLGRSSSILRYQGHEPPDGEVWSGETVLHRDMPPDDCAHWFSRSWLSWGYSPGDRSWFQSPQECRALATWRRRLALLSLPPGLERIELFPPLAPAGESAWLFARRSRPTAEHPEWYVLLRFTDQGDKGGDWLVVPWPSVTLDTRTLMVADTERGGVWVSSPEGLFFSDGQTVQKMLLTAGDLIPVGPDVSDLTQDQAGRLWAATGQGLLLYDEASDRWLATEIVDRALITGDDEGGLWALSDQVSHFDGERWQHHGPADPLCTPRDIAADVGGGLWMTSHFCELLGFDGRQWAHYGGGQDVQGALLERGPNGELYAAVRDDRIQRYDGATWQVLPAPVRHSYQPVEAMAVDRHGGVWIGYAVAPYLRYFDGKGWHEFSDDVNQPVYVLLVDARGHLWVGGDSGLLHYDGQDWARIATETWVRALAEDRRGRIWAGGPYGLYVYDPARE